MCEWPRFIIGLRENQDSHLNNKRLPLLFIFYRYFYPFSAARFPIYHVHYLPDSSLSLNYSNSPNYTVFSKKKLGLVSLEIIPHTPSGDSIVPFFFCCLELNTRLTGNWNVQTLTTASCLFSLGIGEKYGLCRVSKYRRKITVELGRHRDRKPPA